MHDAPCRERSQRGKSPESRNHLATEARAHGTCCPVEHCHAESAGPFPRFATGPTGRRRRRSHSHHPSIHRQRLPTPTARRGSAVASGSRRSTAARTAQRRLGSTTNRRLCGTRARGRADAAALVRRTSWSLSDCRPRSRLREAGFVRRCCRTGTCGTHLTQRRIRTSVTLRCPGRAGR